MRVVLHPQLAIGQIDIERIRKLFKNKDLCEIDRPLNATLVMKHVAATVLTAGLFASVAGAADRYQAKADSIACDYKPAMIEFVKAMIADNENLALQIALQARREGVSCKVFPEDTFVVAQPSGFGLLYIPEGGYYSPEFGFDQATGFPMTGGWRCHEQSSIEKQMGHKSAVNLDQNLTLTRTKEHTVLYFNIPDGGEWSFRNATNEVNLRVDGGEIMTRPALGISPEIELDPELTSALKRGHEVSISIFSEEGSAYKYKSHLIGFSRAYDCIQQP